MKKAAAVLSVFLLTLAFWAPCARYRLVNYDDSDYVFDNAHVLGGLSPANVKWAWTDTRQAANWHPLTWMSLQLDVSLSGMKVRPVGKTPNFETAAFDRISSVMHVHNALLHALNAALLLVLVLLLLGRCGGAGTLRPAGGFPEIAVVALAVLVWAVHPLRAEAVAWVSERKEVLSAFFMLLTLIAHVWMRSSMGLVLALLLYALALAAKPVAVSLPAVIFAIDWCFGGKPRWGRAGAFAALAAGCVALTLLAQREVIEGSYLTFRERLPNVLAAFGTYGWQTIFPVRLSLMYPVLDRLDMAMTFASVMALGGAWAMRENRLVRFAAAWIVVGLLPMIGILQVGCQAHADRYTYWVGCGLTTVLALASCVCASKMSRRAQMALVAVWLAAAAIYGALGWRQRDAWRDTEHVFGMSYRNVPCPMSATAYAQAVKTHDRDMAESIYREARAKFPDDAFTISQLALFLAVNRPADRFAEAVALAQEALSLDPECSFAFEALGFVAVRGGDFVEAEKRFLQAIERGSDSPAVRQGLDNARKGLAAAAGPLRIKGEPLP